MTGQIHDTVVFRRRQFSLLGADGKLPEPADFGMTPVMIHTACWTGYYSTFAVVGSQLYLVKLTLREREGRYQPINGTLPRVDESCGVYRALRIPVALTGGLLIGADFMHEYYVHMGWQAPQSFRKVHQLEFTDGKLVSALDLSAQMAEQRAGKTLSLEPQAPPPRNE